MTSYKIEVNRGSRQGKLKYTGGISLTTTCWWDPKRKIPAKTYTGCSATMMATKNREGVFIPNVKGYTGIFIHKGDSPRWSDGCIVIKDKDMQKIYKDIEPKNSRNVTVVVKG